MTDHLHRGTWSQPALDARIRANEKLSDELFPRRERGTEEARK